MLVFGPWGPGLHGSLEAQAFQHLHGQGIPLHRTETLCRLVLLGLLPALVERDWRAFGEALYDFNGLAGDVFRLVQGGTYARPETADLVAFIRQEGVPGVGQSSWGPAVFAVAKDEDQGEHLRRRLGKRFALNEDAIWLTAAANEGAAAELAG